MGGRPRRVDTSGKGWTFVFLKKGGLVFDEIMRVYVSLVIISPYSTVESWQ
jgi:hypothetical protein